VLIRLLLAAWLCVIAAPGQAADVQNDQPTAEAAKPGKNAKPKDQSKPKKQKKPKSNVPGWNADVLGPSGRPRRPGRVHRTPPRP